MDVDTSGFEQQNPDEDIDDIVREYNIQVSDMCFSYLPTGGRWHNTGVLYSHSQARTHRAYTHT